MRLVRNSIAVLLGGAALAALALLAFWRTGQQGSTEIESWARGYLKRVAQEHLAPRLEIGELDYRYPRTLELADLRLADRALVLLEVERLRLDLEEIPRVGRPLRISQVDLQRPRVRLHVGEEGRIAGWNGLVIPSVARDPQTVSEGFRLSDFLRMQQVAIRDAGVEYAEAERPAAMVLSGIGATLACPPEPDAGGWYELAARLTRESLFSIELAGRINLDTGELELAPLALNAALTPAQYAFFPPAIQEWMQAHAVRGGADVEVRGTLAPARSERALTMSGALRDLHFVDRGRVLNAAHVSCAAEWQGATLGVRAEGDALGGRVRLAADSTAEAAAEINARIQLDSVAVSQVLALLPAEARQRLAGVDIDGRISGDVKISDRDWGLASATIEGRGAVADAAVTGERGSLRAGTLALDLSAAQGAGRVTATAESFEASAQSTPIPGGQMRVEYAWGPDETTLQVRAAVFAGQIEVDARVSASQPAQAEITGTFRDMDAAVAAPLLSGSTWERVRGLLAGSLSGRVEGSAALADWAASSLEGDVQLTPPREARPDALGVQSLSATVALRDRRIDADARFSALGGSGTLALRFDVAGSTPMRIEGDLGDVHLALLSALANETGIAPAPPRIAGRLSGTYWASFPPGGGALREGGAQGTVRNVQVEIHGTRIDVPHGEFEVDVRGRALHWRATLEVFDGRIITEGALELAAPYSLTFDWEVRNVRLEQVLLTQGRSESRYEGRVAGNGAVSLTLADPRSSLAGHGRLRVEQGALMHLPVISDVLRLIWSGPQLVLPRVRQDEARATFELAPDRVRLSRVQLTSPALELSGGGDVFFDRRLALEANVKALPQVGRLLAPVAELLSSVTDRLMAFRIAGTLDSPRVELTTPLGR